MSRDIHRMEERATEATKARYSRIAPIYDLLEILPEFLYQPWRERFWSNVAHTLSHGEHLLEVGVGTGKNMRFWPEGVSVTAVDLTPGMVVRARKRAETLGIETAILEGDVQSLEFKDESFEAAAGTFVFCSVPDPIRGLTELARVVRPGGSIVLMEHVRSRNPLMGKVMDGINPVFVRLLGANIDRDTIENVKRAGLKLDLVEDLGLGGIFKIIRARVPLSHGGGIF